MDSGSQNKDIMPQTNVHQDTAHLSWELKRFKEYLKHYLDAEYRDGEDIMAVRSNLIDNGELVGRPSTFLVHMYLRSWDENQNFEKSFHAKHEDQKSESQEGHSDIFVEVVLRMVKAPEDDDFLSNFKVSFYAPSVGKIYSECSPIAQRLNPYAPSSVAGCLPWNKINKIGPDESITVTLQHYVYAEPGTWGLERSEDVDLMCDFLRKGKIDWDNEGSYSEIMNKCGKLGLTGVVDCFDQLAFCEQV